MKSTRVILGALCFGLGCLAFLPLRRGPAPSPAVQPTGPRLVRPISATFQESVIAATPSPPSPWVAALQALESGPDLMQRDSALQTRTDSLAAEAIPALIRELRGQAPTETGRRAEVRLIRRWTETDPHAAASWAEQIPPGSQRQEALSGVAIVWANHDLTAASQWARQLTDGTERARSLTSVAYEAARREPLAALHLAVELPPAPARDELIRHATRQWAELDGSEASQWAQQLEDAPLRAQVLADIAAIQAESDPEAAATLAMTAIPAGQSQDDALVSVVQRWSGENPREAAAWVETYPEGVLRDAALENLVKLWTQQEPDGPAHWLNSLPLGPLRDAAVETFARAVASVDADAALAWAETIGETTRRDRSQRAVSNQ